MAPFPDNLYTWANAEDDESKTGERITALTVYRFQVKIVSQTKVIAWILGADTGLGFAKRFILKFCDSSNFPNKSVDAERSYAFLLFVHAFMFRAPTRRALRRYPSGIAYEMCSNVEGEIQTFLESKKSTISTEAYEKVKYYKNDLLMQTI